MTTPFAVPHLEAICCGSPHEMGLAQGAQLKAKINEAMRVCFPALLDHLGSPWWMPNFLAGWIAKRRAQSKFGKVLQKDHPQFDQRLAGIVEAAGLDLKTGYFLNALESAFSLQTAEHAILPAPGACSAIAVSGKRSASGEAVIVRNFDYLGFVRPYCIMRESRPAKGFRSLDFTLCPLVGTVDGVNEAGLAITLNYAYTKDAKAASAPLSMRISEALSCCRTVSQAAGWLADQPRWGGGILMLADASGDIASLELSSTRAKLRRPEDNSPMVFHTNAYFSPEMQEVEVSKKAVFGPAAEPSLRGVRVHKSAEHRLDRLITLLSAQAAFSADELVQILCDHGPDGQASDNTLCVHGSARETTACLQLFPASRRMKVSYSHACQAKFGELAL